MSCQSTDVCTHTEFKILHCKMQLFWQSMCKIHVVANNAPGTFFIGFFEFGQGHRGPMIPYCPKAL
ncbi:unnamed protein product, partial [Staurois parvus]